MKKIMLIVGVFVLVLSLGAMSFADSISSPIKILSGLTNEEVSDLKDSLQNGTKLKDLAETYGVQVAFEEAMTENLESAIEALVASGELTALEGEELLEIIMNKGDQDESHKAYKEIKRSYLRDEEKREGFKSPFESLIALTQEEPEVMKDLLKDQKPIEVAINYDVLEAFESERILENISLINTLYANGLITSDQKIAFASMVEAYDYLENKDVRDNFKMIKDWLKENTERPSQKYRELFKSPVEIYSELTGQSVETIEALLNETTLRALVKENELQEVFMEMRITNIKSLVETLTEDGLITSEAEDSFNKALLVGEPRSIQVVISGIKEILKK